MYPDSVVLTDEQGRTLPCEIERACHYKGEEYLLLAPVDTPVQILAWREVDGEDQLTDIDDAELAEIFPIAKAVLAEQNLLLKHTAYTLTVEGELPEIDEEQVIQLDDEDGEGGEELQEIAQFYAKEQAYSIFVPLDLLFFSMVARRNQQGGVELLSPEEIDALPIDLKDELFDFDEDDAEE
ncbi:MAG: DUF3727 domain-containing protein [Pseudanabaenaceae cyanobacterium]